MAQISKISEHMQLKCSGEKYYEFFKYKFGNLSQMFPKNIPIHKVLEGNGFSHGSILYCKYDIGSPQEAKQKLHLDDSSKTIIIEFIEGDLFEEFEMLQVVGQVSDGGSNGNSSVKWTVEFVKAKENVSPPLNYLQFSLEVTKGIEAYCLCNK